VGEGKGIEGGEEGERVEVVGEGKGVEGGGGREMDAYTSKNHIGARMTTLNRRLWRFKVAVVTKL
jgi:hypothetical protein